MAPVRDLKLTMCRLVAALLLFVVAMHAAAPFAQAFERSSGSAFSAATSDVSLACASPAAVAKRTLPAHPVVPILPAILAPVAEAAPPVCGNSYAMPGQTGPPPSRASFSPISPRAPPAA